VPKAATAQTVENTPAQWEHLAQSKVFRSADIAHQGTTAHKVSPSHLTVQPTTTAQLEAHHRRCVQTELTLHQLTKTCKKQASVPLAQLALSVLTVDLTQPSNALPATSVYQERIQTLTKTSKATFVQVASIAS
jgi:hypothetical protein